MSSAFVTPGKRSSNGINGDVTADAAAKKPRKAAGARAKDIEAIKSIVDDIQDPGIKAALEGIIRSPPAKATARAAVVAAASPEIAPKKDEATLQKMTDRTVRAVQSQISAKLQWKGSFKQLRHGDATRGARVEAACPDPDIFERIFAGTKIKRGKDGKLSCSVKAEDEEAQWRVPFKGKSYRYNQSYLSAPYTANWKEGTLTFGFKFGIR